MCKLTGLFVGVNSMEVARAYNNSDDMDFIEELTSDFVWLDENSTKKEVREAIEKYNFMVNVDQGGIVSNEKFRKMTRIQ